MFVCLCVCDHVYVCRGCMCVWFVCVGVLPAVYSLVCICSCVGVCLCYWLCVCVIAYVCLCEGVSL